MRANIKRGRKKQLSPMLKAALTFFLTTAAVLCLVSFYENLENAGYEKQRYEEYGAIPGAVIFKEREIYLFACLDYEAKAKPADMIYLIVTDPESGVLDAIHLPKNTRIFRNDDRSNRSDSRLGNLLPDLSADDISAFTDDLFNAVVNGSLIADTALLFDAVDRLGGIELELAEPVVFSDPQSGTDLSLIPGKQILSGKQIEGLFAYLKYFPEKQALARRLIHTVLYRLIPEFALSGSVSAPALFHTQNTDDVIVSDFVFAMMCCPEARFHILPGTRRVLGKISYFITDKERSVALLNDILGT